MNKIMFKWQILLVSIFSFSVTNCKTTNVNMERGSQPSGYLYLIKEKAPSDRFHNGDLNPQKQTRDAVAINSDCPCKVSSATQEKPKKIPTSTYNGIKKKKNRVNVTENFDQVGIASWYGRDFDGRPTASGEIFDSRKLSAAHKKIPLGSIILVRNMENDKQVFLKVNDRGPFVKDRIVDLSEYAAEVLGYKEKGLAQVSLKVVRRAKNTSTTEKKGATFDFFQTSHSDPHSVMNDANAPVGGNASFRSFPKKSNNDTGKVEEENTDEVLSEDDDERNYYSLQVGSFKKLKNALRFKHNLRHYKQPIHLIHRGKNYLIHIGTFASRYDVDELKKDLQEEGYSPFLQEPQ